MGPVRLEMLAPSCRRGPLGKERLLDLVVVPVCWQRQLDAGRAGDRNVLVDGALREGTTSGDLVLAQSERREPQHFFQLAHGQPLLWQMGVLHFLVDPATATAALRTAPIPCRSVFRTITVVVIGFGSEH